MQSILTKLAATSYALMQNVIYIDDINTDILRHISVVFSDYDVSLYSKIRSLFKCAENKILIPIIWQIAKDRVSNKTKQYRIES